jgi:hypothetical protein
MHHNEMRGRLGTLIGTMVVQSFHPPLRKLRSFMLRPRQRWAYGIAARRLRFAAEAACVLCWHGSCFYLRRSLGRPALASEGAMSRSGKKRRTAEPY